MENNTSLITFSNESENATPLISADKIAELVNIKHKSINQAIRNMIGELGQVLSEKADRKRIYYLNEYQSSTLLDGLRTTKFTKKARRQLKRFLFNQFKTANKIQTKRQLLHEIGKPVSKSLNEAIQNNPYSNSYSYSNYNKLIYKVAMADNPKHIRDSRHIPASKSITEYLTPNESTKVQEAKNQIIVLLNLKLDYQHIKGIVIGAKKVTKTITTKRSVA